MLCLCLAILCSTLVSVVMRVGSSGQEARKPMLAVNYLTCAAVSLCFLRGGPVPKGSGAGVALGMGLAGGVLYLGRSCCCRGTCGRAAGRCPRRS